MERWQGKVAIVTGATSGIGACVAKDLLRAGVKVVGLARRRKILEEIAERANEQTPGSYYPIVCDLSKEEDILAAFAYVEKNLKTVHILINSAGVLVSENIIEGSTENFRKILDLNVLAVAICAREATKLMRKHNVQGHIINVNSLTGHSAENLHVPVSLYSASKYAVTGMTITLRNELHRMQCGIKISSISPGPVNTEMIRVLGIPEEVLESSLILDSQNVSDAIIFALSTPPAVQVNELKISPLNEIVQRYETKNDC